MDTALFSSPSSSATALMAASTAPRSLFLYKPTPPFGLNSKSTLSLKLRHITPGSVCAIRRKLSVACSAITREEGKAVKEDSVSVVLLAGGQGKRMGLVLPSVAKEILQSQPVDMESAFPCCDVGTVA